MTGAEFEASVRRRWEETWNQIRNRPVVNGTITVSGTEFAAALEYADAVLNTHSVFAPLDARDNTLTLTKRFPLEGSQRQQD